MIVQLNIDEAQLLEIIIDRARERFEAIELCGMITEIDKRAIKFAGELITNTTIERD